MHEWIITTLGGGATALAILVAFIGFAGALGGAITSYFVSQQSIYVNAITTERMKWVNSLKILISSLIAKSHYMMAISTQTEKFDFYSDVASEHLRDFYEMRCLVALQINPKGVIDNNLLLHVDAINESLRIENKREILEALQNQLRWHAQWLFKIEWEKIKREARSPFVRLATQNKVRKLEKKYAALVIAQDRLSLAQSFMNP